MAASISPARTPRAVLVVATVLAALVAMLLAAPSAQADDDDGASPDRPVLLVGVPGLAWSDVARLDGGLDPFLARDDLALGSLVVRSTGSVACPVDGWLAISAGNRASGARTVLGCTDPLPPVAGLLPQWPDHLARAADASFSAEPGLLGDTLAEHGVTSTALGPGAAVALATSAGTVADYHPFTPGDGDALVADALGTSDLVVVDLGDVWTGWRAGTESRADAAATAAAQLAVVLEGAEQSGVDPVVVVSGISDDGAEGPAALRVLAVSGLDEGVTELVSPSTRQNGYTLATDQQATLLDLLGVDAPDAGGIGAVISPTGIDASSDALVAAAVDRERHAEAQRPLVPGFFLTLVLLNLLLYGAVALGLRRPQLARTLSARRSPVLTTLRVLSLGVAAIPISSFLVNLAPWWRVDPPAIALLLGILLVDTAIVALALLGPWRRALLGPAAVVAGTTALVLAVDVVLGAPLQVSAIMGIPTLVAGRFYGMNNTSFALFSASLLLVTTAIANAVVQRGRRVLAALVVAGLGIAGILIDGAPFWGADFGGPPAMLVAFGLLALLAAGIRLTIRRVALVVLGAGAITMGIAVLDWLRPPGSRTHLGRFFADVLDGDLWVVVGRKLDQNLTILLGNRPLTILAICGVALVVLVLIRPVKATITSPDGGEYAWLSNGAPISAMAKAAPLLGPGLVALAVSAGIGFAVNDSGIAIPAIGVAVVVPLLLASCATWMLSAPFGGTADGGAQAERSASPAEGGSSDASAADGPVATSSASDDGSSTAGRAG